MTFIASYVILAKTEGVIKILEETFVLIKPDGVERGLVGKVISRFERVGLKIKALKMAQATPEIASSLYPDKKDWLRSVGNKMLQTCQKYEIDVSDELGTDDTLELGKLVRKWLMKYITSGRVVAMILTGNRAVEATRKLIGDTNPLFAQPGTIRGDFSTDSADFAGLSSRAIYNIVHASGTPEEAEYEISLWFGKEEQVSE